MLKQLKQKRNIRSILHRFAEIHDLVMFGDLSHSDDIDILRGATFTPLAKTQNFMHGNINGYEVSFFTRDFAYDVQHKDVQTWSIVSIELTNSGVPHMIFDNKKHDSAFYNHIKLKFPRLVRSNDVIKYINPMAQHVFDAYIARDEQMSATQLLNDTMLQRMSYYYGKFDVEIDNNRLYVFTRGEPLSITSLNEMLNEAIWLAFSVDMKTLHHSEESPQFQTNSLGFVST